MPDLFGAVVRPLVTEKSSVAYQERKEHAKAIKQLEAAVAPNDADIYKLLVASHDALNDKEGAIRQLLQGSQLSRRDIKLYKDLGERYAKAGQAQEAERAFTSIVEMLPTESESHTLLAEVREKEGRWQDAIGHWQQVASLYVTSVNSIEQGRQAAHAILGGSNAPTATAVLPFG